MNNTMNEPEKNLQQQAQDILLYSIAVIFAGIGIYQGAIGYAHMMDKAFIAWAFMIAVGLCMLVMDVQLKNELEQKRRRSQISRILGIYLVLAMVNMLGNFNAFFTNSLRGKLVAEQANGIKKELQELLSFTSDTITKRNDASFLATRVQLELSNLRVEITDPKKFGIGDEAKIILQRLAGLLGVEKIQTPASTHITTPEEANALFAQVKSNIEEQLKLATDRIRNSPVLAELRQLNDTGKSLLEQIDNTLKTGHNTQDIEKALQDATGHYNTTLGFLRGHIGDTRFKERTAETGELGKMHYTLDKASSGKYNEAVGIALAESLFIDFIVPLIFLGAVRRKENAAERNRLADLEEKLTRERNKVKALQAEIESLKRQIRELRTQLTGVTQL